MPPVILSQFSMIAFFAGFCKSEGKEFSDRCKKQRRVSTKILYKSAKMRYIIWDYSLENGLITYGT
jgi:hypothetical protein